MHSIKQNFRKSVVAIEKKFEIAENNFATKNACFRKKKFTTEM